MGRGFEEQWKEMGDHDDERGEGVQESETSRGTDASMREVQGLSDGDVHMVDGGTEEHDGMDVDGPAPGEDFRFDEDENERRCTGLWSSPSSKTLYRQGRKYPLLHHRENLPPRLLNPLHGRIRRTTSLLLLLRKRRRRTSPRRRS